MFAAVLLMSVVTQAPLKPCPAVQLAPSLDQALARTLTSVRSGNGNALLAQMSRAGVAFGSEGGIVPYAALSDQFSRKSGHYCDLFACGGRTGKLNALFNGGKTDKSIDLKHNRATVVLNGNTQRELDLGYAYTPQCAWELTSIGAL
jgi:hypothetical protein